jgi:hypothetical protein
LLSANDSELSNPEEAAAVDEVVESSNSRRRKEVECGVESTLSTRTQQQEWLRPSSEAGSEGSAAGTMGRRQPAAPLVQ